jgi:hypothetical protein
MHEQTAVVDRAVEAYQTLADLAEAVEDEWQYVTDLTDAYLTSIQALAEVNPGRSLTAKQVDAVDEAIAEIGLITDPHKAIDWLSTFPHLVALALGVDMEDDDLSTRGSGADAVSAGGAGTDR